MTSLPAISGKECIRVLEKAGFHVRRQDGSHVVLRKDNPFCQVVVPNHKTLDRGTLRSIIRHSGLSVDEFVKLLNS
ncbi:MAG: type II toxin-antitoxin system HicA family toxin [Candidatus Margulisiibacteriota bacterium]